jgi:polysaccharide biosynthesis protein PslA
MTTVRAREQATSRRGPMRPSRLVSVRANQSRRLSSFVFRLVDLIALLAVTIAVVGEASAGALLSTPLRVALPFVLGALALGRSLRSLGGYRFVRSEGLVQHLGQLIEAYALSAAVVFLTRWLIPGGPSVGLCAQWLAIAAAVLVVLHAAWWLRVRAWQSAGWLTPNLFIVGATEYAEHVISEAIARRHVNVLGVFDDRLDERTPRSVLGVPVLGDIDALLAHKITSYVDRIVIAVEPTATSRVREIAARLAILPNEVTLFLARDNSMGRAAALARLEDSPLADLNGPDLDRKALAKRGQDLLIGLPMLMLASPFLAVIALLIKLDSRGPVFFRQRRHGFNNEEIVVWKFRSMRADAADAQAARQVSADDDRVTRIGRILRKTSLDELPQLLNVLRGEMSLVGPRPHAIGMKTGDVESARLVAEYAHRHRIKPGMTGWAAINGSRGPLHAAAEVQRRVAFDIDYIARQSFRLDLRIIAMTLPGLLGDRRGIR